jgi:hypothetical protein
MLFIALILFIMYEYVLMLIFWCSHCGSTIFVGVGFSYALRLKVRRSTTRPHVEPDVDRPFSNGGQLMCHEDASPDANLLKTVLVLLGHLMLQHKIFVNEISAPLRGLIM